MGVRSLLEPRNTVQEGRAKRYTVGYGTRISTSVVVERVDGDPSAGCYSLGDHGTLAESLLFDYFGTAPDPKLAKRFDEQFVSQYCQVGYDPTGGRDNRRSVTGLDIHYWLDSDCVIAHEPDGSAGFCTLAESEGLFRLAIRRLRGR